MHAPMVLIHIILRNKPLFTHITDVRTLSSMYTHVFCQFAPKTETFTTQITEIWIVIVMLELMFFQSLQVLERLITNITEIRSLLSMNDFMTLHIVLKGK